MVLELQRALPLHNEGGIGSPMIVHWPNGIRDQNKLRHNPCRFVDIVPTQVDLAPHELVCRGLKYEPVTFRQYQWIGKDKDRAILSFAEFVCELLLPHRSG